MCSDVHGVKLSGAARMSSPEVRLAMAPHGVSGPMISSCAVTLLLLHAEQPAEVCNHRLWQFQAIIAAEEHCSGQGVLLN